MRRIFLNLYAPFTLVILLISQQTIAEEADDLELASDPGSPIELTFESCIKMAVESATSILNAKSDVELGAIQVLQAYGQYLPNLGVSAGLSGEDGRYYNYVLAPANVVTRDWGPYVQLSSSVNIFNGHADAAGLRSALDKRSAALLSLAWARQQIALDVAQGYLQVIYDNRLLELSRENLKVSKARQELLDGQTKTGIKEMSDLLRQEAITSRDEASIARISASAKTDTLALLKRLRLDARKQYHLAEPKISRPGESDVLQSEDDLVKLALQSRPDLKASAYALVASKRDIEVADAGLLPKVDFGVSIADVGRQVDTLSVGGANALPASQPSLGQQFGEEILYTVGLTVRWNIFDRDLTKVNVERARVATRNRQMEAEDVQNSIVIEVKRAYTEYMSAKNQLKANEAGLIAAEKAFQVIKARYDVGVAKFIDLADAQATLVQAQAAEAQSVVQVELQRRALIVATGQAN